MTQHTRPKPSAPHPHQSHSRPAQSRASEPSPQPAATSAVATAEGPCFADLALHESLLSALKAEGYERPTPIQAQAIPHARDGRDLLGIAQTGTGKTAAFALPILHRLLGARDAKVRPPAGRRPRVLVLAPTRELAAQIGESFATYGRHTLLREAVIFGGVGQGPQVRAIAQGVDVLVATPGRLIDLLDQRVVDLGAIECFVLDEADRMLDMGFIQPIRRIARELPRERHTMLFSATMPKEISELASQLLRNPARVEVTPVATTVERIDQRLYFVLKAAKTTLLAHLLHGPEVERAIVFTKTKHGADKVVRKLRSSGLSAEAIHGNKGQNQRVRALEAFRSGRAPVLVATDIAARGLDVDGITHVFNHDLPMEPEAYVHRIGRTARAGASGIAISFCGEDERELLRDVERLIRLTIPRVEVPRDLKVVEKTVDRAVETASERMHESRQGGSGRNDRSRREASRSGPARGQPKQAHGRPQRDGGRSAEAVRDGARDAAPPSRAAHPASGGPVAANGGNAARVGRWGRHPVKGGRRGR